MMGELDGFMGLSEYGALTLLLKVGLMFVLPALASVIQFIGLRLRGVNFKEVFYCADPNAQLAFIGIYIFSVVLLMGCVALY